MARALLFLCVLNHVVWGLAALLSPSPRPEAGRGLERATDAAREAREHAVVARVRAAEMDLARLRRPGLLTPDARLALARAVLDAGVRGPALGAGGLFADWDADL